MSSKLARLCSLTTGIERERGRVAASCAMSCSPARKADFSSSASVPEPSGPILPVFEKRANESDGPGNKARRQNHATVPCECHPVPLGKLAAKTVPKTVRVSPVSVNRADASDAETSAHRR